MTERYPHLDGLRGLAAANVVLSHAVVAFDFALYTGAPEQAHGAWEVGVSGWPLLLPGAGANASVCVFLVLSGFVLAHAFLRTRLGVVALAAKRAVRLGLPVLAGAMLGYAVLAGGVAFNQAAAGLTRSPWLGSQLDHPAALAEALFEGGVGALSGAWEAAGSYDSVLWSMPIEFAGSLVLIGVFGVGRRALPRRVLAPVLVLLGVALWPHYVALMLFGAALRVAGPWRARAGWGVAASVVAAAGLLLMTLPYSPARGMWAEWLVGLSRDMGPGWQAPSLGAGLLTMDEVSVWHGVGGMLLVVAVTLSQGMQRVLNGRFCRYLGRISFPLYVLHMPVLLSLGCGVFLLSMRWGVAYPAAVGAAVLAYAGVAAGVAHLAVHGLERPAVALGARAGAAVQVVVDAVQRRLASPLHRAGPPLLEPRE